MIEVRISRSDMEHHPNEVVRGQFVLNKLRNVGVPVFGILWMRGVEVGVLKMHFDEMFDEMVYQWFDATESNQ